MSASTAASAQSIFTIAGGGTTDGRPATVADLNAPAAVAFDASGNLYIAEYFNNRIRKVATASGIISTVAGNGASGFSGDGGPATAASLYSPSAVALDAAGNLYIGDTFNNRIRKVDEASGKISTVAGSDALELGDGGAATAAEITVYGGIALDAKGNLYIADGYHNRIRKVDANSGIISTVAGNGNFGFSGDGGPATAASLGSPGGIGFDGSGNLYIADSINERIRKVDAASGIISTVAGNGKPEFSGDGGPATNAGLEPFGIAFDLSGNLYIADLGNERIRKVAAGSGIISTVAGNGKPEFSGDGGPATNAGLDPFGIAFDLSGNLYIADFDNNRIRRVDAGSGIISTAAGNGAIRFLGDGGLATAAGLDFPQSVAPDTAGNLYIADSGSARIRKVDAATAIISTVAGGGSSLGDGGPATAARLNTPESVALDSAGNIYIADKNNYRVRKVAAGSGIISTVAGNGTKGFSGDGGPATAASLASPRSIVVDAKGNLYIADISNSRVRKVDAITGIISTAAGNGTSDPFTADLSGDGGPATAATLNFGILQYGAVAVDASGNLYIAESGSVGIRKVDAASGIISTVATGLFAPSVTVDAAGNLYGASHYRISKIDVVSGIISMIAGNGLEGFSGDAGPAISAGFLLPMGVAVDASGNVYVADPVSVRVRFVPACVTVRAAQLTQPAAGSAGEKTSPKLAWTSVKGAFHYDVYLDTVNPPQTIVATDVTSTTYSPSNLEPLTTYYWKVVAKGDRFCTPFSTASSDVQSFTTTGACSAPGSLNSNSNYSLANLDPLTTHYWKVVAKGDPFWSFTTTVSCSAPGSFQSNASN